jgi:hypothetical protein
VQSDLVASLGYINIAEMRDRRITLRPGVVLWRECKGCAFVSGNAIEEPETASAQGLLEASTGLL